MDYYDLLLEQDNQSAYTYGNKRINIDTVKQIYNKPSDKNKITIAKLNLPKQKRCGLGKNKQENQDTTKWDKIRKLEGKIKIITLLK